MEKDINKYAETIEILRNQCKQKDKEIHQAATFGQQLLNEKIDLRTELHKIQTQLEVLEQEKYSLQLNLESQKQTVITQAAELEIHTKTVDDLKNKLNNQEKKAVKQKQRFENLEKEKCDLERAQQDLQFENSSLKSNIKLLNKQIETLQDNIGLSLNETGVAEEIHNASLYLAKSKELEEALVEAQQELRKTKLSENRLTTLVKELEEVVSEQAKELSTYSTEIQKEKQYSAELQCEIEVLKLDQLNPKARGNSMFEELDDRRKLVEKEYKILSKKYENVLKNYDENKKDLASCKCQIAILQSMTYNNQNQDRYINKLENLLSSSRKEVDSLTSKLTKVMKSQAQQTSIQKPLSGEKYDYLRLMNQQAEMKAKDAEKELMIALMKVKSLKDSQFESEQHTYKIQRELSELKIENLKLQQDIKELTFQPDSEAPTKTRVEIRPGFESNPETLKLAEMALNENCQQRNDIIPGELLLTEKGFVEIKAPKLSTKAMLRNNLHKLNVQKSAVQENNTLNKINEDTENVQPVIRSDPSISQVKPNDCAQQ